MAPAPRDKSLRPASASMQAVLPGVKEHPADWREFQPEVLTVEVFPGKPVSFTRSQVKDEGKYVTWVGRNADIPGASLVGVSSAGRYDAVMILPGLSQFSVHIDPDGRTFVQEADPGAERCGVESAQSKRSPAVSAGDEVMLYEVVAGGEAPKDAKEASVGAVEPTVVAPQGVTTTVDVLFLYDAVTLAAAKATSSDPVGYIDGYSKGIIESGNLVLAQSGVANFQWRYLGVVAAPAFAQTDTLEDDLDAMATPAIAGDKISQLRYEYGADQIHLWHGSQATPDNAGGQAFGSRQRIVSSPVLAVAVSRWTYSYRTVMHELAHNFGCHHNRENMPSAADGDGFHAYGMMWTNPTPIPNYPYPNTASTIMGYGSATIPYFSNPDLTMAITAVLVGWPANSSYWGVQALGVPVGQPRAANNAKVLRDNAAAMGSLIEEITVPAIIDQPASATVPENSTFYLSANVKGGGLEYQWFKDGVALPGATQNLYSQNFVTQAQAGSYHLVARNRLGSVTSNPATITVSGRATLVPPSGGSGGGGGGGGGGAPSGWFICALSLLGLGRWWRTAVKRMD